MEFNFVKLFKEWYNLCHHKDDNNQALSDDDINLGLLKLKATNCEWKTVSNQSRNLTHKATISNQQQSGVVQDHTSIDCDNGITVTIENGVIKGLYRFLALPVDKSNASLVDNFGKKLEIDPSKRISYVKGNNLKLELAMERPVGCSSEEAMVTCIRHEYKGCFRCTVVIKGRVPVRSGKQPQISCVLQELKDQLQSTGQSLPQELESLKIVGENVVLEMIGQVDLCWQSDHNTGSPLPLRQILSIFEGIIDPIPVSRDSQMRTMFPGRPLGDSHDSQMRTMFPGRPLGDSYESLSLVQHPS